MARAVISGAAYEPLYETDPQTGGTVEVFYADRALAASFGKRGAGFFWWTCQPSCVPKDLPVGPFATSYAAYLNWTTASTLQS